MAARKKTTKKKKATAPKVNAASAAAAAPGAGEPRYQYDPDKRFQTFTTPPGTLFFPHLNEPRDYKGDRRFAYDTGFLLEGDDAAELEAFIEEMMEVAKKEKGARRTGAPPFDAHMEKDPETGELEEVPGVTRFKFKVPAQIKTKRGLWDRTPVFYDAGGNPIDPKAVPQIGGGTKAAIAFEVRPWKNPAGASVSLQPRAVQIIELVSGGALSGGTPDAGDLGFGAYDEGFVAPELGDDGSAEDETEEAADAADF